MLPFSSVSRPALSARPCVARGKTVLLAGVSLSVLALAIPAGPALAGISALAAAASAHASGGASAAGSASSLSGGSIPSGTSALAQAVAARSANDLAASASAIAVAQAAQTMAHSSALAAAAAGGSFPSGLTTPSGMPIPAGTAVPDGLSDLGLKLDPGVGSDPSLWQNAALPTQSTINGTTTVTVKQNGADAILTWQQFNVGAKTTVHFDQSAGTDGSGNNKWVVLNRVDATGTPSQILGMIQAEGSVYVINPNGVVFSGTAQVDVHSLVASALDIGSIGETTAQRDSDFLQEGLKIPIGSNITAANLVSSDVAFSTTGDTSVPKAAESVTVQAGARITTTVQGADNPGTVMLLGSTVSNAGKIDTPAGQTILAAGRAVAFYENTTVNPAAGANYLGLVPETSPAYLLRTDAKDNTSRNAIWAGTISATNTGLIEAARGNITLQATNVENDGVLAATTSITRNGSIVLQGLVDTVMGGSAIATILPDNNVTTANPSGETIPLGSAEAGTVPKPYLSISATQINQPNAGTPAAGVGAVTLDPGSTIIAPGATLNVLGGESVYVGENSLIDVAGLTTASADLEANVKARLATTDFAGLDPVGTILPVSANLITFTARGPELADSPLQQNSNLNGETLTVDIRNSGTRADGTTWVGTPLANVSGYVNTEVTDTIEQLLTTGGSVSLATAGIGVVAGQHSDAVVLRPGSTIDVSGGYASYAGGLVTTSELLGTDGKVYSIANADPSRSYVGLASTYTVAHAQWGVAAAQTYATPSLASGAESDQPGYIQGSAAGSISLIADSILADGTFYGQAVAGARQTASGVLPTAGSISFNVISPQYAEILSRQSADWGILQASGATTAAQASSVLDQLVSQTTATQSSADFTLDGIDTSDRADTLLVPADVVTAGGFQSVSIVGTTRVAADATLAVAPGGTISIVGPQIDVQGTLSAPSGTIKLTANGTGDPSNPHSDAITIETPAVLSVRGRWVNDAGIFDGSGGGPADINAGSILLLSDARTGQANATVIDTTGGIAIAGGATLDLTGGGYVNSSGQLSAGGKGGSLTLETYAGGFTLGSGIAPDSVLSASLTLDPAAVIEAEGFSGGGTLKISVGPSITITDQTSIIATQADGSLSLPSTLFGAADAGDTKNGFSAFDIESDAGSVTVASTIHLNQVRLQASAQTLALHTGGDVSTAPSISPDAVAEAQSGLAYEGAAVNLTLGPAQGDLGLLTAAPVGSGNTIVNSGVSIVGDAGASIKVIGIYQADIYGSIVAPGGAVLVQATGNILASGQVPKLAGTPVVDGLVSLGQNAEIDVSGNAVVTSLTPFSNLSGSIGYATQVLSGGTVTLQATASDQKTGTDDSFGEVISAAGSTIDISGATGTASYLVPTGPGSSLQTPVVASDAGALTVDTVAGILGGSVTALGGGTGGSGTAADGILTIESPVAALSDAMISNTTLTAPDTSLASGQTAFQNTADGAHFIDLSSTAINQSQFDDILLGQTDPAGSTNGLRSIIFNTPVTLTVRRSAVLAAPISLSTATGVTNHTVTLNASYITLATTAENFGSTSNGPTGILNINASNIDLERGYIDAGSVVLNSTGDVRVIGLLTTTAGSYGAGGLVTDGRLTITAREIYTTGGTQGLIESTSSSAKAIQIFQQAGTTPVLPTSAGGTLYILGQNITQDGVVWVPGGSIIFGARDLRDNATFFTFGQNATTPGIVAASTLTLDPGSITSVSLDNAILPWGGTVDGKSWYYGDPTRINSPVVAPPAKSISLDAAAIDFQSSATIDISGGGDLYATEFVAGNGGSRNVLSTQNAYATTAFNGAVVGNVSLDSNVAQVYAIVPQNYNFQVAPTDIDFASVSGLGFTASPAGLSITLSGDGSFAGGTYLLLPAAYATLPGAYRVVVEPATANFVVNQNTVQADGSYLVAGTFTTSLAGGKRETAASSDAFLVQSSSVWRRYSEIDQASANSFTFSQTASPRLPIDAGQLVAAASTKLDLSGSLLSSADSGGRASIVDIAASKIDIVAAGIAADAGYVGLQADQLSNLGAGSLVIGGTETVTAESDVITPTSASIEVSTTAVDPLTGSEIILVTGGSANANGILVKSGSSIIASEKAAGTSVRTITIGSTATGHLVRGDGALLAVTSLAPITIDRVDLPVQSALQGSIAIESNAVLQGSTGLVLDASATGSIDPTSTLSGGTVEISGAGLNLGAALGAVPSGFTIPIAVLSQISAASIVTLRSYGAIDFYNNSSIALTASGAALTLDGDAITSADGTAVALAAGGSVTIENNSGISDTGVTGAANLSVATAALNFGTGNVAFDGFSSISLTANNGVSASGIGGGDFGNANLLITTPQILAQSAADATLMTTGSFSIETTGSSTGAGSALGGSVTLDGGSIFLDSAILSPSGTIALEATTGNLTLGADAAVNAQGYAQQFNDVTKYAGGGSITLTSDQGSIVTAANSSLDVSGSVKGGNGGSLTISALKGSAVLGGTYSGGGATNFNGGSFALTQAGAITLDDFVGTLSSNGFNSSISIESGFGNLTLDQSLAASDVSLTADAGSVTLAGAATIDASGVAGGTVQLDGATGVDVEGQILARGSDPTQAGGTVRLITGAVASGQIDPTYGYELTSSRGTVTLGASSKIDVSGGTTEGTTDETTGVMQGGLTGGVVFIRVPYVVDGSDLAVQSGAGVTGAHDLVVEGYATWSTSDSSTGGKHFDGIVDPAGWYSDTGVQVAGTLQSQAGTSQTPQQFFTPTTANADHVGFYQGTLLNFVQNYGAAYNAPGLAVEVRPGIVLSSNNTSGGPSNLTIASNWNLGAGGYAVDASGNVTTRLFYRTSAGQPGDLVLRATGNVIVNASVSDGFFQTGNTLDPLYSAALGKTYLTLEPLGATSTNNNGAFYITPLYAPDAPYSTTDATYSTEVGNYYKAYSASLTNGGYGQLWLAYQQNAAVIVTTSSIPDPVPYTGALPTAPSLDNPQSYGQNTVSYSSYMAAYQAYVTTYNQFIDDYQNAYLNSSASVFLAPPPPAAPDAPQFSSTVSNTGVTDPYATYLGLYQSNYAGAYQTYLTGTSTLAGIFNFSSVNLNGSNQLYIAPTPLVAPVPWGATEATSNGVFSIANTTGIYGANGPANNPTASDPNPIMSADLVSAAATSPNGLSLSAGSWSLTLVAGADTSKVDPKAVQSLASFATDKDSSGDYTSGAVTVNNHTTYTLPTVIRSKVLAADSSQTEARLTALVPTIIRTGTGSIDIAAATDVTLTDKLAPGAIYTGGIVGTALDSPGYGSLDNGAALNGPKSDGALQQSTDGTGLTVSANPSGFDAPDFTDTFVLTSPTLFAVTTPAYPEDGGDVTITAQNDITGIEDTPTNYQTSASVKYTVDSRAGYLGQYWTSWLLARSSAVPGNAANNFDASQGVYNANTSRGDSTDQTAGQTTWWVNFGSFDQGAAALGGGNVTLLAGRDIRQFAGSTVSTGRVAGGLDANSLPILYVTGGGNLTVSAGRNIDSGAYYVALGHGQITAGGAVQADPNWHYTYSDTNLTTPATITVNPSVVLAVGDGQLDVRAGGSIDIGAVVNPTEINSDVSLIVGDQNINLGAPQETSLGTDIQNYIAALTSTPQTSIGAAWASFANLQSSAAAIQVVSDQIDADKSTTAQNNTPTISQYLESWITAQTGAVPSSIDAALALYEALPLEQQLAFISQVLVSSTGGASNIAFNRSEFVLGSAQFNTLSQASALDVQSTGGQVVLGSLPSAATNNNKLFQSSYPLLPASVTVTSLRAGITVDSNFDMTNSTSGSLDLLAYTNLRLAGSDADFDTDNATTIPSVAANGEAGIATYQTRAIQTIATAVPVPGLIDTAFDPENPANGYDSAAATYQLLHKDGASTSHLYALTGDFTNGPVASDATVVSPTSLPIPILSDMPIFVEAGNDILDLQLYAQNTQSSDVTLVQAGRDISYDLPTTNLLDKGDFNGLNLIDVSGGGSVFVSAGRNLGPFPNNFNPDASEVYGIITTGQDGWTSAYVNTLLPETGASIYVTAGTGKQPDYQAVIDTYINPANAATAPANYLPALAQYLDVSGLTPDQLFAMFEALPATKQNAFVDQIFFSELKETGIAGTAPTAAAYSTVINNYVDPASAQTKPTTLTALDMYVAELTGKVPASDAAAFAAFKSFTAKQQDALVDQVLFGKLDISGVAPAYQRGYEMIATLFPASQGYTNNNVGSGANGAVTINGVKQIVSTGNIDLRSATIQTQHGGSVSVLVPGGNILLGSTVSRAVYNRPADSGILTLQNGNVNVFADQDITVNQSRILTEEGGDVLAWSSNADVLAGIGSKTSADFPPYAVLYDANAYQQLNPAGLVTGAGIGALVTLSIQDKTDSNAYLIAPVGTVDAGSAGLRSANNIIVAAAHVANAGNIQVGGSSAGVPQAPVANVSVQSLANSATARSSNGLGGSPFDRDRKKQQLPSIITIDILEFDGPDSNACTDTKDHKKTSVECKN